MSEITRIAGISPGHRGDRAENQGTEIAVPKAFTDFLKEVNNAQFESREKVIDVAAGDITDIHEAMLSVEKASLSFQILLEFRNKVLDAYNEVVRMRF